MVQGVLDRRDGREGQDVLKAPTVKAALIALIPSEVKDRLLATMCLKPPIEPAQERAQVNDLRGAGMATRVNLEVGVGFDTESSPPIRARSGPVNIAAVGALADLRAPRVRAYA